MSEHRRGALRALHLALAAGLPVAAALVVACSVNKEPPKVRLDSVTAAATQQGQADSSNPHADRLAGPARASLDLANAQYRAGKYGDALASYRAAAKAAPDEAAPYFGIYMVAQKQGNKALADSALHVIQGSSGLNDSTLRDVHVNTKTGAAPKG